jgi:hypothetical protein
LTFRIDSSFHTDHGYFEFELDLLFLNLIISLSDIRHWEKEKKQYESDAYIYNEFLENVVRNPENEFGFLVLSLHRKFYNLPAYICVDDGGSWIKQGAKNIILFESNNSGNADFDKLLPMSIEDEPQILIENAKIDLSPSEINQIKEFVIKYQKQLLQMAKGIIHNIEFLELLDKDGFRKKENEIDELH